MSTTFATAHTAINSPTTSSYTQPYACCPASSHARLPKNRARAGLAGIRVTRTCSCRFFTRTQSRCEHGDGERPGFTLGGTVSAPRWQPLLGLGLGLVSIGAGELFAELRYQRNHRALFSDTGSSASDRGQQALSVLVGYALGNRQSSGSFKIGAGRQTLALKAGLIATRLQSPTSATSDYQPGFADENNRYRHSKMSLDRGRLIYPTRIMRESLPRIYPYILDIEAAYAAQAQGPWFAALLAE